MDSVAVQKTDTCLTYVLKRIGLFNLYPLTYPDLVSGEYFKVIKFLSERCRIGDLLLWDDNASEVAFPLEITGEGKVLTKKEWRKFHLGVVETNEIYSDFDGTEIKLVRLESKDFPYPTRILRPNKEMQK